MGADLYIQPKFDDTYEELKAKGGSDYDSLYTNNPYYFRDSYNAWSVFRQLNLSWWKDCADWLDDEGNMSPEKAQGWLTIIKSRAPQLEASMSAKTSEEQVWYRGQFEKLQAFYQRAIDENLNIRHSV